jgi:hypothetical protein
MLHCAIVMKGQGDAIIIFCPKEKTPVSRGFLYGLKLGLISSVF